MLLTPSLPLLAPARRGAAYAVAVGVALGYAGSGTKSTHTASTGTCSLDRPLPVLCVPTRAEYC